MLPGMENDVVLAEPEPVAVHRPPADHDPMGMQYALWLSGRTRSKDEISRIVGRGRRVVGGSAFGSEPPRLNRIEHARAVFEPIESATIHESGKI